MSLEPDSPESSPERRPVVAAFIPPVIGFIVAGLTKLISFDVGWQGIVLLVGFAVLGGVLQLIPHRSITWNPPARSSLSALKQTIGTMRVIVSIVLVVFPIVILASSKTMLHQLPQSIDKHILALTDEKPRKQGFLVFLPKEPKDPSAIKSSLYAGRYVINGANNNISLGSQQITATPGTQVAGELYVLQLTFIVDPQEWRVLLPFFAVFSLTLSRPIQFVAA